jgi:hypothetical protein
MRISEWPRIAPKRSRLGLLIPGSSLFLVGVSPAEAPIRQAHGPEPAEGQRRRGFIFQKSRTELPKSIDRSFEHLCANVILSHCTSILCVSAPPRESVFLIVTHWK